MNDAARRTGRTALQMKAAPHMAVFVCESAASLEYTMELARHVDRSDLQIVSPTWLEESWRGREPNGLVVDHAAQLTDLQRLGLTEALKRIPGAR